jgi:multidrug efflux pump subunit AcrB
LSYSHRVLSALGETLITMTLGGLALAIGISVDDAPVNMENIHRHMVKQSLNGCICGRSEIAQLRSSQHSCDSIR